MRSRLPPENLTWFELSALCDVLEIPGKWVDEAEIDVRYYNPA
jgi:hypothetical protein